MYLLCTPDMPGREGIYRETGKKLMKLNHHPQWEQIKKKLVRVLCTLQPYLHKPNILHFNVFCDTFYKAKSSAFIEWFPKPNVPGKQPMSIYRHCSHTNRHMKTITGLSLLGIEYGSHPEVSNVICPKCLVSGFLLSVSGFTYP